MPNLEISQLPELTTPANDDVLAIVDIATDTTKKITKANLLASIPSGGTVTNVSVATANGISGLVSNPTTTPEITLELGAITPTTVRGNTITTGTGTLTLNTFTLTAAGNATVSGVNSGDQNLSTYVVGPASATDNAIARFDGITGKLLQNSTMTITDAGSPSIPTGQFYLVNGVKLGGGPYLLVAAFNAPTAIKNRADYICDGTADNVEIQAAIDALPTAGGGVLLSEGSFNIAAEIQLFDNAVRVEGAGMDATIVTQGTANTNGFHVGNRQSSGVMANRMYLGKMTINLPGTLGNTAAGVLGDGLGTGSHLQDIICNEGGFGIRLKDLDRAYVENCHPSNQRTAGFRCETGLENTWGTVTFTNCSAAVSDNNGIAWDWNTAAEQASPNRFDRVTMIGCLFYMTPGLTGVSGLKFTVGATSFNCIGCLFENNTHQLDIIGETQINLTGCSWISTGGVSTNIARFQTNNHFATFTDCRFQASTNGFNDVSGFSRLAFYGHNTNQGTITNLFVGNFSSKEGTDTLFAGSGVLISGVDVGAYAAVYIGNGGALNFNNGDVTFTHSSNLVTVAGGNLIVSSAGTASGSVATIDATQTITNKRVTKRVVVTTQSATPTINTDNTDIASITGLAQAITSFTTNLTGTPVAGDILMIQITDNGTARAIAWGASFASTTTALPTTTVISTMLRVLFQWNSATSKWDCIGTT